MSKRADRKREASRGKALMRSLGRLVAELPADGPPVEYQSPVLGARLGVGAVEIERLARGFLLDARGRVFRLSVTDAGGVMIRFPFAGGEPSALPRAPD